MVEKSRPIVHTGTYVPLDYRSFCFPLYFFHYETFITSHVLSASLVSTASVDIAVIWLMSVVLQDQPSVNGIKTFFYSRVFRCAISKKEK